MTLQLAIDKLVTASLQESVSLQQALLEDADYQLQVSVVGHALAMALATGKKVLFFGNGGSAADAQHLAAELTGRYQVERPGLAGLALTVNTSSLTAIGNDYSYEMIFARQLEALGCPGDVAIGISTSGNSANVLRGIEAARSKKLATVGLTGGNGGLLGPLADYCIRVPSASTPRIQEVHILTGHILCEIVERELYGKSGGIS
jgi:D-sedoheptulose 7-phosphate isomerase